MRRVYTATPPQTAGRACVPFAIYTGVYVLYLCTVIVNTVTLCPLSLFTVPLHCPSTPHGCSILSPYTATLPKGPENDRSIDQRPPCVTSWACPLQPLPLFYPLHPFHRDQVAPRPGAHSVRFTTTSCKRSLFGPELNAQRYHQQLPKVHFA